VYFKKVIGQAFGSSKSDFSKAKEIIFPQKYPVHHTKQSLRV